MHTEINGTFDILWSSSRPIRLAVWPRSPSKECQGLWLQKPSENRVVSSGFACDSSGRDAINIACESIESCQDMSRSQVALWSDSYFLTFCCFKAVAVLVVVCQEFLVETNEASGCRKCGDRSSVCCHCDRLRNVICGYLLNEFFSSFATIKKNVDKPQGLQVQEGVFANPIQIWVQHRTNTALC